MTNRVECYAGYRSDQEPLAFWLGGRRVAVRSVVVRWIAPMQRWFKVDADDGRMYVLRHDEATGDWEGVRESESSSVVTEDHRVEWAQYWPRAPRAIIAYPSAASCREGFLAFLYCGRGSDEER